MKQKKAKSPSTARQFDDVLKRMLSTPPDPKIRKKAEERVEEKNEKKSPPKRAVGD